MRFATPLTTTILVLSSACALAAPKVVNPSFEADRYTRYPGLARANGGKIEGWSFTGSVGINPCWEDSAKPAGPDHVFSDNGKVPHGRQVVFLQNNCTLSQRIDGFEEGKRYRVTFYENARRHSRSPDPPDLEVMLGGETIVSRHRIEPVEEYNLRRLPYHFVESAEFVAPRDGALELVFKTTLDTGLTTLLDNIVIEEILQTPAGSPGR